MDTKFTHVIDDGNYKYKWLQWAPCNAIVFISAIQYRLSSVCIATVFVPTVESGEPGLKSKELRAMQGDISKKGDSV